MRPRGDFLRMRVKRVWGVSPVSRLRRTFWHDRVHRVALWR
jgi:hypothetical protein